MAEYEKRFSAHFNGNVQSAKPTLLSEIRPSPTSQTMEFEDEEENRNAPAPDFENINVDLTYSSKFESLFERGINLLRAEIIGMTEFKPLASGESNQIPTSNRVSINFGNVASDVYGTSTLRLLEMHRILNENTGRVLKYFMERTINQVNNLKIPLKSIHFAVREAYAFATNDSDYYNNLNDTEDEIIEKIRAGTIERISSRYGDSSQFQQAIQILSDSEDSKKYGYLISKFTLYRYLCSLCIEKVNEIILLRDRINNTFDVSKVNKNYENDIYNGFLKPYEDLQIDYEDFYRDVLHENVKSKESTSVITKISKIFAFIVSNIKLIDTISTTDASNLLFASDINEIDSNTINFKKNPARNSQESIRLNLNEAFSMLTNAGNFRTFITETGSFIGNSYLNYKSFIVDKLKDISIQQSQESLEVDAEMLSALLYQKVYSFNTEYLKNYININQTNIHGKLNGNMFANNPENKYMSQYIFNNEIINNADNKNIVDILSSSDLGKIFLELFSKKMINNDNSVGLRYIPYSNEHELNTITDDLLLTNAIEKYFYKALKEEDYQFTDFSQFISVYKNNIRDFYNDIVCVYGLNFKNSGENIKRLSSNLNPMLCFQYFLNCLADNLEKKSNFVEIDDITVNNRENTIYNIFHFVMALFNNGDSQKSKNLLAYSELLGGIKHLTEKEKTTYLKISPGNQSGAGSVKRVLSDNLNFINCELISDSLKGMGCNLVFNSQQKNGKFIRSNISFYEPTDILFKEENIIPANPSYQIINDSELELEIYDENGINSGQKAHCSNESLVNRLEIGASELDGTMEGLKIDPDEFKRILDHNLNLGQTDSGKGSTMGISLCNPTIKGNLPTENYDTGLDEDAGRGLEAAGYGIGDASAEYSNPIIKLLQLNIFDENTEIEVTDENNNVKTVKVFPEGYDQAIETTINSIKRRNVFFFDKDEFASRDIERGKAFQGNLYPGKYHNSFLRNVGIKDEAMFFSYFVYNLLYNSLPVWVKPSSSGFNAYINTDNLRLIARALRKSDPGENIAVKDSQYFESLTTSQKKIYHNAASIINIYKEKIVKRRDNILKSFKAMSNQILEFQSLVTDLRNYFNINNSENNILDKLAFEKITNSELLKSFSIVNNSTLGHFIKGYHKNFEIRRSTFGIDSNSITDNQDVQSIDSSNFIEPDFGQSFITNFPLSTVNSQEIKAYKLMYKIFSEHGYGFRAKRDGRTAKKVMHIGIPSGLLRELQLKTYAKTGDASYLQDTLIAINIFKQNDLNPSEKLFPKTFIFDMNKYVFNSYTSRYNSNMTYLYKEPRHILNYSDNWTFNDILNNIEIASLKAGRFKKYAVGLNEFRENLNLDLEKDLLSDLPYDIAQSILKNHLFDTYLKLYYQSTTGLIFDEDIFNKNQNLKLDIINAIDSSQDLKNLNNDFVSKINSYYPNAYSDPNLKYQINRLKKAYQQNLLFTCEPRLNSIFDAYCFDRVFSIPFLEGDFVIDSTEYFNFKNDNLFITGDPYLMPDASLSISNPFPALANFNQSNVIKNYASSIKRTKASVSGYTVTISLVRIN